MDPLTCLSLLTKPEFRKDEPTLFVQRPTSDPNEPPSIFVERPYKHDFIDPIDCNRKGPAVPLHSDNRKVDDASIHNVGPAPDRMDTESDEALARVLQNDEYTAAQEKCSSSFFHSSTTQRTNGSSTTTLMTGGSVVGTTGSIFRSTTTVIMHRERPTATPLTSKTSLEDITDLTPAAKQTPDALPVATKLKQKFMPRRKRCIATACNGKGCTICLFVGIKPELQKGVDLTKKIGCFHQGQVVYTAQPMDSEGFSVPANAEGVVVDAGTVGIFVRFCSKATWEVESNMLLSQKAEPRTTNNGCRKSRGPYSDVAVLKHKWGVDPSFDFALNKVVGSALQRHGRNPRDLLPDLLLVLDSHGRVHSSGYPGEWPTGTAKLIRQKLLQLVRVPWEDVFSQCWKCPPSYRYMGNGTWTPDQKPICNGTGHSSDELIWGYRTEKSMRSYQEDRWHVVMDLDAYHTDTTGRQLYFGVHDGHNGQRASEFCTQELHKNIAQYITTHSMCEAIRRGYMKTDENWKKYSAENKYGDGTCSTSIIFSPSQRVMNIGYIGDCWAVLARGRGNPIEVLTPNIHHGSDEDEKARIEAAGGRVIYDGDTYRVDGELCVSRAIGDYSLRDGKWSKPVGLSCEPEVGEIHQQDGDEFLIVASDGLWDVISLSDAVKQVRRILRNGTPQQAANNLVKFALKRNTSDNITVIVIGLQNNRKLHQQFSDERIDETQGRPFKNRP